MFLYMNIELVNKQPIKKCLTLNYDKQQKISLSLCTNDKNVAMLVKELRFKTKTLYFSRPMQLNLKYIIESV